MRGSTVVSVLSVVGLSSAAAVAFQSSSASSHTLGSTTLNVLGICRYEGSSVNCWNKAKRPLPELAGQISTKLVEMSQSPGTLGSVPYESAKPNYILVWQTLVDSSKGGQSVHFSKIEGGVKKNMFLLNWPPSLEPGRPIDVIHGTFFTADRGTSAIDVVLTETRPAVASIELQLYAGDAGTNNGRTATLRKVQQVADTIPHALFKDAKNYSVTVEVEGLTEGEQVSLSALIKPDAAREITRRLDLPAKVIMPGTVFIPKGHAEGAYTFEGCFPWDKVLALRVNVSKPEHIRIKGLPLHP